MALALGAKAPAFTAFNQDGEKVALKDFQGQWVVLYFYPKDLTPGCTTEACDFRDQQQLFKRSKVMVLGVSKDDAELHQKFIAKHGLSFDLLVDADGKICEKYGVWQEKSMYGKKYWGIIRSTFLIDPAGILQKVYSKVKVNGHVAQVLADLKELK
jgi:peroxiredoxin Q/BCP